MTDLPGPAGNPPRDTSGATEEGNVPPPTMNLDPGHISTPASSQVSREGTPPPLPPRPKNLPSLLDDRPSTSGGLQVPAATAPTRPPLQSKATTAVSLTEIQSYKNERSRDTQPMSRQVSAAAMRLGRSQSGSEADDTLSIRSYAPTLEVTGGEMESMLEEVLQDHEKDRWQRMGQRFQAAKEAALFPEDLELQEAFDREFEELDDVTVDGSNEDRILAQWKSKLKHFLIISSAGKPVYSRHGSDAIISHYIGVIHTIISAYQEYSPLRAFTAGHVRFVVLSKGNLNLVAISRLLNEGDNQLRVQLESLYMQILSTLTLPAMDRIFANRPSTDLRRPLEGTETLLSALADGFTRGSPSTLLSALECLKLRKSHRQTINQTLLKTRCSSLLYGLIVASGRLVSVVRPKKHSLHPGDLHLIFNMLFEAGGVKAGGGENWIPLCLPGFNNTGFLYMYVSFLGVDSEVGGAEGASERPPTAGGQEEIAILLISTSKDSFYELKQMRDDLVEQLRVNKGLHNIRTAVKAGRPLCTDLIPGTPLRHFLYKSRGNVQFTMPSYEPWFNQPLDRRRLMSLYTELLNTLHARPTSLKIIHCTNTTSIMLAWSTPLFELCCVASGETSRAALAQAANKVVQWVRREEERLFIIGGAVF